MTNIGYKEHHIEVGWTSWTGWEVGVRRYYGHTWTREFHLPSEQAALDKGKELVDKGLIRYSVYDPETRQHKIIDPRQDQENTVSALPGTVIFYEEED